MSPFLVVSLVTSFGNVTATNASTNCQIPLVGWEVVLPLVEMPCNANGIVGYLQCPRGA